MTKLLPSIRIAIVEDDVALREELRYFLTSHAMTVFEANSSVTLDELLMHKPVDLLILDLNLPGQNGFEIAVRIRQTIPNIGIIMLTARTAQKDRVKGYESGADIYLPKPTSAPELLAAVVSLHRRLHDQKNQSKWTLDVMQRLLIPRDDLEVIPLTAIECLLIMTLTNAPNHSLDTDEICEIISQKNHGELVTKRALENIISRLRKKIAATVSEPKLQSIRSIWGLGYEICLPIAIINA
ncbi:OmpR Response regulators consisting of a CheY-like receiver domain and a winged-helix DNA-binding domain [Methylophilaceae bacterium]